MNPHDLADAVSGPVNTALLLWIAIELRLAAPRLKRIARLLPKVARALGIVIAADDLKTGPHTRAATSDAE